MKRLIVTLCLVISASLFGAKPNIIFIMADDLGYEDLGVQGSKDIVSPAIDALAKDGVRFTNAYACHAFCGPSRAGFITGRYPHRYGSQTNPIHSLTDENLGVPVNKIFLSLALKAEGYKTAIIGKWHLGAAPRQRPDAKGFDYFYGFLEGSSGYFKGNKEEYLTDTLSEKAVEFVEENKDKPFFMYLAYNAPHTPLQAKKDDLAKFEHIKDKQRKAYTAMIYAMDKGIGTLIEKLKALGIYDNTIIAFASDNGGVLPYSSNAPLRGEKRKSSHDGGCRVPFIISYKAKVEPRISDEIVSLLDFFPTVLSIAGAKLPENLDGVDISKYLIDKAEIGDRAVFIDLGADIIKEGDSPDVRNAVRYGKWKLVSNGDREIQSLYNIVEDISEENDLAGKYPEVVMQLNEKFIAWDKNNIPVRYEHASASKKQKTNKKNK